jgi:hypothetical protein
MPHLNGMQVNVIDVLIFDGTAPLNINSIIQYLSAILYPNQLTYFNLPLTFPANSVSVTN